MRRWKRVSAQSVQSEPGMVEARGTESSEGTPEHSVSERGL
ncbi:hypothetical protein [Evansella sp. LMS18]|nr:hypothetical protein [Evansella sp. LMS18]